MTYELVKNNINYPFNRDERASYEFINNIITLFGDKKYKTYLIIIMSILSILGLFIALDIYTLFKKKQNDNNFT